MKLHLGLSSVFALVLAACGGSAKPAPATTPSTPSTPSPAGDNAALADRGGQVYGAHCAKCHGDAGQGGDEAPAVVGKDALPLDPRTGAKRDVQFHTAADVATWVMANMPGDAPGTLSTDDYLAVLAFDLKANGVDVASLPPITADSLASIKLH